MAAYGLQQRAAARTNTSRGRDAPAPSEGQFRSKASNPSLLFKPTLLKDTIVFKG